MNPFAIAGIAVSALSSLLTFAFFLGFYFGTFKEFKKTTEESIARLMSVYFTPENKPRTMPASPRKVRAHAAGTDYED